MTPNHFKNIIDNGFTIIDDVYSQDEINAIISVIDSADKSSAAFRQTNDLFAIRKFLEEIPEAQTFVFNDNLKGLIKSLFGDGYFIIKSIYFDKPRQSNWFVAWHQDLTISVDKKANLPSFGPWTTKLNQFSVQPPVEILQNNFTIRIHLDDTDENNGALKVIPGSNLNGIYRTENIDWQNETEIVCKVKAGGVMIMRPLLMHASNRTTNNKKRRVIHVEFGKDELPKEINWSERESFAL